MKPAPFRYHDPLTVAEAADLVARLDNAKVLAGGQSLMPMMNFRLVMPDDLIDLNRVPELAGIVVERDRIRIGAMTRQRDIEFSAEIGRASPVIQEALSHVGHRQTRNRGTVGGSLCHLDPSAELVSMLLLHDGRVEARSVRGSRTIPASEFVAGYMTPGLQLDEIATAVELRRWPEGHGYAFEEVSRRHGDFAICAVGVLLRIEDATVREAAVTLSGVGQVPVRLGAIEAMLVGERPGHPLFRAAAEQAQSSDAMADAYVTAEYRQHLARILTYRALASAADRASPGSSR